MSKGTKTFITRRRFERIVIRRGNSKTGLKSCALCGEQSAMISIEEACAGFGIKPRGVFQLLESGTIHFAELPIGLILVCFKSLEMEMRKFK